MGDNVLIDFNNAGTVPSLGGPVRARTLLTNTRRHSRCNEVDRGELNDLTSNPNETHNPWAEPGAATARYELAEALADEFTWPVDESPVPNMMG